MRPRRAVSKNLRATFLTARGNCSNFLRITSLADPHPLTPIESHPYKNRGRGYLLASTSQFRPRALTILFATHPRNRALSPIIATLPKTPSASPLFATHPRPPTQARRPPRIAKPVGPIAEVTLNCKL